MVRGVAWRIHDAVVRGEIDNTVEGKTSGRLWLVGRDEPVVLELDGDCWRDLAGARLSFRNPAPKAAAPPELDTRQRGLVGDMTASRKCRVPRVDEDELAALLDAGGEVPFSWRNMLYLEWFSESQGRVVIESGDFELQLSDRLWEMDEDGEEAQKLANLQAMRDFMNTLVRRNEPADGTRGRPGGEDEFQWEERLKQSERLADAYQEVIEKYLDDPDAERKEAFAMGWDGLLEALADESEGIACDEPDWQAGEDEEAWRDEESCDPHPLQERAHEVVIRGIDLTRAGAGHPAAAVLTAALMQVAGKLAGALNGDYERETGFVLAMLKRCLGWQNDALAACGELIQAAADPDHRRALEALRDSIFAIREDIVNLRKELKGN